MERENSRFQCYPFLDLFVCGALIIVIALLLLEGERQWQQLLSAIGGIFLVWGLTSESVEITPATRTIIRRRYFLLCLPAWKQSYRFREIREVVLTHPSARTRPAGGRWFLRDSEEFYGLMALSIPEPEVFFPYEVYIKLEGRERFLVTRLQDHRQAADTAKTLARTIRKPLV